MPFVINLDKLAAQEKENRFVQRRPSLIPLDPDTKSLILEAELRTVTSTVFKTGTKAIIFDFAIADDQFVWVKSDGTPGSEDDPTSFYLQGMPISETWYLTDKTIDADWAQEKRMQLLAGFASQLAGANDLPDLTDHEALAKELHKLLNGTKVEIIVVHKKGQKVIDRDDDGNEIDKTPVYNNVAGTLSILEPVK